MGKEGNLKVRSLRANLGVRIHFQRPLLRWVEVPNRFFECIYGAVKERHPVRPNDFSVSLAPSTMGDVYARYSVYGGVNNVTLFADRLTCDFSDLIADTYPIALDFLRTWHDGFKAGFPECLHARTEVLRTDHLEIDGKSGPEFMNGFRCEGFDEAFAESAAGVVQEPGIQFRAVSEDGRWTSSLTAEKSLLSVNAVFITLTMVMVEPDEGSSFEQKEELANKIAISSLAAIGLEATDE